MARNTWRNKRSFGPTVTIHDNGEIQASCTWCVFRVGNACTHVKPFKRMTDLENTPDWCQMLESMMHDAKKMYGSGS